jgi:hypothetical protein
MSSGKITNGKIELSTNFSVNQDIKILINTLKNRFGLVCSIDVSTKNLYVIIVSKESVQILQDIVSPYIIPNFRYKIGLNNRSQSVYHKTLLGYNLGNRFYSTSNNPLQNSFAASYPNPVLLKSVIYKENLKKAGIYRWTNLITGDTYIGSSINLTGRFVNYFSTKHLKKVELAKNNLSKGLTNWENASVKGVVVTNVITNDSVSYNTIIDAARALNVSRKTISRRLKDQKVLNYLYKFSYA